LPTIHPSHGPPWAVADDLPRGFAVRTLNPVALVRHALIVRRCDAAALDDGTADIRLVAVVDVIACSHEKLSSARYGAV